MPSCFQVRISYGREKTDGRTDGQAKPVRRHENADFADVVQLQHTYEFKKANGESVNEDVSADVKDNYVQYHLTDHDSEIWVLDDFNRVSRLTVFK